MYDIPITFDKEVPEDSILMTDALVTYRDKRHKGLSKMVISGVVMKVKNYDSNIFRIKRMMPKDAHPIKIEVTIRTFTK